MLKITVRLKTFDHQPLLTGRIITFLLATLLISIGVQDALRADRGQLIFETKDIKDIGSLAVKLQDPHAVISQHIAARLSAETRQLLGKYDGTSTPSLELQEALLDSLNLLLQSDLLYDVQSFSKVELSEHTEELLAESSRGEEALVRLNRSLLADAYPYELASPSEKQTPRHSEGIEVCRENLRRIQLAFKSYRDSNAGAYPQWLSELSPQYFDEKVLLCPADATNGKPGVLTEGGSDPIHPCSYLYEMRPAQKTEHELLQAQEGEMTPIVRCEHHRLNLSSSGKLYRSGPQRGIYNSHPSPKIIHNPSQKMFHVGSQEDLEALRELLGDDFFETQDGKDLLKNLTEQPSASKHRVPSKRPEPPQSITRAPTQKTFHVGSQEDLEALRELLGDDFFETQDGKDLLEHAAKLPSTSKQTHLQNLVGESMLDVAFRDLSGTKVTLEPFRGKFVLVSLFSAASTSCGQELQQIEKQLENADTSRLRAIGISTDNTLEEIAMFKKNIRYQCLCGSTKNLRSQSTLTTPRHIRKHS